MTHTSTAAESLRTGLFSLLVRYGVKPITIALTAVIAGVLGPEGLGRLFAFQQSSALLSAASPMIRWFMLERRAEYLAVAAAVAAAGLGYLYFVGGPWLAAASLPLLVAVSAGSYMSLTLGTAEPSKTYVFSFISTIASYAALTAAVVATGEYVVSVIVSRLAAAAVVAGGAAYAYARRYGMPDVYLREGLRYKIGGYALNLASTVVWALLYPYFMANPVQAAAIRAVTLVRFGFTGTVISAYAQQLSRSSKPRDPGFEEAVSALVIVEYAATAAAVPLFAHYFYHLPVDLVSKYALIVMASSIAGNLRVLYIGSNRLAYNPRKFFWRRIAAQFNNLLWLATYFTGDPSIPMTAESIMDYALTFSIGAHKYHSWPVHAAVAAALPLALLYPNPVYPAALAAAYAVAARSRLTRIYTGLRYAVPWPRRR